MALANNPGLPSYYLTHLPGFLVDQVSLAVEVPTVSINGVGIPAL